MVPVFLETWMPCSVTDLTTLVPDTFVWFRAGTVVDVRGVASGAFGADSIVGVHVNDLPTFVSIRALVRLEREGCSQLAEWTLRGADGLLAWEGRVIQDNDEVLVVVRATTEQRRAQMSNAAQRERLAVTLRSIGDGVVSTDREERVVLMNPAAERLLGTTMELAKGKELGEVLGPHQLDAWGAVRDELTLQSAELGRRVVRVSMAPVLQHGQMLGAVYALRDVTTELDAEVERLRASKLESVGLLAGGIAHDFNNLLAAIQGNISVVRQIVTEAAVLEILEDVDIATRRATALTRQLLTFSSGGAPVKAVASIDALVREAVDFGMRGSNVRQSYAIDTHLSPLEIDADQVARVLQNLVINACHAMPDGGELRVEASNCNRLPAALGGTGGRWVRVSVSDEGTGIPESHLGRIFDPYYTTKPTGTGLGLATAYAIIRKHQGFMTVESEEGRGSTFSLFLPSSVDADSQQAVDVDGPLPMLSGRVLVVDDEPALRTLAERVLDSLGLKSVCCEDGEQGVAAYREALEAGNPFDAVMLDLTIRGGMGGREAVLRILDVDPDATCIAMSGYSTDPVLSRFADYGFRGRLAKPYDRRTVGVVLNAVWPKRG
jgi:PAS domain S-box-containing protein